MRFCLGGLSFSPDLLSRVSWRSDPPPFLVSSESSSLLLSCVSHHPPPTTIRIIVDDDSVVQPIVCLSDDPFLDLPVERVPLGVYLATHRLPQFPVVMRSCTYTQYLAPGHVLASKEGRDLPIYAN